MFITTRLQLRAPMVRLTTTRCPWVYQFSWISSQAARSVTLQTGPA